MKVSNTMEALLADGFSKKQANTYLGVLKLEDENDIFDPAYRAWAHENGFYAIDAYAFGLTEETVDDYLSDYQYNRLWPINSWCRSWIDDKMTLRYMLAGTEFDDLMPKTYFYATPEGLAPLVDAGGASGDYAGFLAVLRDRGEFACKPCNGQRAAGFHKLAYANGRYFVDNQAAEEEDVRRYLDSHVNDIFTEFLHPGMGFEKVSPVIHTLRIQVANPTKVAPVFAGTYMRFSHGMGNDDSKANYRYPSAADISDVNVDFDVQTGTYGNAVLIYPNRVEQVDTLPDTGASLAGVVECWPALRERIRALSQHLNLIEWMGYDLAFTTNGPKIIEINSHSGVKYLQFYHPFWKDEYLAGYFRAKEEAVDRLVASGDEAALKRRNNGGKVVDANGAAKAMGLASAYARPAREGR